MAKPGEVVKRASRNAVTSIATTTPRLAANAADHDVTCADLILGGYTNPIPLDEAIDASYEVGKALPGELRCTARGGCAVTPSALVLPRLR